MRGQNACCCSANVPLHRRIEAFRRSTWIGATEARATGQTSTWTMTYWPLTRDDTGERRKAPLSRQKVLTSAHGCCDVCGVETYACRSVSGRMSSNIATPENQFKFHQATSNISGTAEGLKRKLKQLDAGSTGCLRRLLSRLQQLL